MQILRSPECYETFSAYLELCLDLSVDWLQRVYQFYCAERKEKKLETVGGLSMWLSFQKEMGLCGSTGSIISNRN